jgi:hypothetical protein
MLLVVDDVVVVVLVGSDGDPTTLLRHVSVSRGERRRPSSSCTTARSC